MRDTTMRKFSIEQLSVPKNGLYQIYCDRWWAVSNEDEIYFYGTTRSPYGSPQCNPNQKIALRVASDGLVMKDGCFKEVRQIPVVYVPVNISDYV